MAGGPSAGDIRKLCRMANPDSKTREAQCIKDTKATVANVQARTAKRALGHLKRGRA